MPHFQNAAFSECRCPKYVTLQKMSLSLENVTKF
jgi:hypothetical protein